MRLILILLCVPSIALSQKITFRIDSTGHDREFYLGMYRISSAGAAFDIGDYWILEREGVLKFKSITHTTQNSKKVGTWKIKGDSMVLDARELHEKHNYKMYRVVWQDSLKKIFDKGELSAIAPEGEIKSYIILLSDTNIDLPKTVIALTQFVNAYLKLGPKDDDFVRHDKTQDLVRDFLAKTNSKFGFRDYINGKRRP